jgi:signal transduction histidine kinase
MRLATFIEDNVSTIVDEAEQYARSVGVDRDMLSREALRDHLPDVLKVIVADMQTAQSGEAARLKSLGEFPPAASSGRTSAQTHAGMRLDDGFNIVQMVSEYRALRASVLRLWSEVATRDEHSLVDVGRFNEAIDQAVAESVDYFAQEVERWRNVFLGVLGHELRGPLSAILLSSELLRRMGMDSPISQSVAQIIRGGERMRSLLDDLLDFNRTSLGFGLLITRREVDLAQACASEIELLKVTLPDQEIEFTASGITTGLFDESRVREVVWNLVTNAAKYGEGNLPIHVSLSGDGNEVKLSVLNVGAEISQTRINDLFDPLRRGADTQAVAQSLGLGLFVVKEVAKAHGGEVEVRSSSGTNTFTVTLAGPAQ